MKKIFVFALAESITDDAIVASLLASLRSDNINVVAHGVCGFYMRYFGCVPMASLKSLNLDNILVKLNLYRKILSNIKQHKPSIFIVNKNNRLANILIKFVKFINPKTLVIDINYYENYKACVYNGTDKIASYDLVHPISIMPKADDLKGSLMLHPGKLSKAKLYIIDSMLTVAHQLYEMQLIKNVIIVVDSYHSNIDDYVDSKYQSLPMNLLQHSSHVKPDIALIYEDANALEVALMKYNYYQIIDDSEQSLSSKLDELMQTNKINYKMIDKIVNKCCQMLANKDAKTYNTKLDEIFCEARVNDFSDMFGSL